MVAVKHVKLFENPEGEIWAALFAEPGLLPELWIKNVKAEELGCKVPITGITLERKYELADLNLPPREVDKPGIVGFGLAYAWNRLGIRETHEKPSEHFGSLKIFLSYANEDQEDVRQIYASLNSCRHLPWMDEVNLRGGVNWENDIKEQIGKSDLFIACISQTALNKSHGFVQDEYEFAINCLKYGKRGQVFLIPILLEECEVPEIMRHIHCVDYFRPNGFNRLLEAIALSRTGQ